MLLKELNVAMRLRHTNGTNGIPQSYNHIATICAQSLISKHAKKTMKLTVEEFLIMQCTRKMAWPSTASNGVPIRSNFESLVNILSVKSHSNEMPD